MVKVLISDKMSPRAAEILRDRGIEVDEKPGMSPEELLACIADYDGLAVRSATKVTPEVLERASRLKVIGRAGIGVDNIAVSVATENGVCVMNTPFGNSITTAEHAIAMMFAVARDIPAANASTHAGKWEKSRFMGIEVTGKSLGIIGCGNIGSIVAERALGLRMKVLGYDPFLSAERASALGIEKVELDELLRRSDFITLHTPLTDQTAGILGAENLAKTRKGVRIINCARGGLIDEAALKDALESGQVAAAALDVFLEEPAFENILFGMEQVTATPHLGASTREAQENVAIQVADQMADFLLDGAVTNALNMPSVTAEEAPRLQPYMELAEELGSFAGQITESGIRAVRIEYEGKVAELNTTPLTAIVLQGLLKPLLENVNMVNAPVIAKARNIDITEVKHERPGDYQTLMRLVVTTEQRSRSVAGTLFADAKPRVVEISGIQIEAELGTHMLYVTNADKPGFIGSLGSTLGEAGLNIATFHLGRAKAGGDAIALIEVDQHIDDAVLDKVCALPLVYQAKTLHF